MFSNLRSDRTRAALDVVTSIVVIIAASGLLYSSVARNAGSPTRASVMLPREPLSIRDAPTRGSATAEFVLVEFADFQCPFCARFVRETLPEIERRYVSTGRLLIAFQHLPLPIHPHALKAAIGAECARQQDRFWDMHDRLFGTTDLDEVHQRAIAETLGLDVGRFDSCIGAASSAKAIQEASSKAAALGIAGTPTFYLGTRTGDGRVEVRRALSGALPLEDFVKALDALSGRRWASWIPLID